jgi:hypothetical protein
VFFFDVITFVTVCTEVVTTQERSHAGNHIVVVVVIVQVDLLIGIVERFTIKLKMIGYIVKIVDDTSKDQHALISTRRRRHREIQPAPPITNVRTADKP